ncbi:MAG: galactose-1-phosphate uridylyltransferase [Clostridia bacterium]
MIQKESVAPEWVSVAENRQDRPVTAASGFCPFCPGPDGEVGSEPFAAAVFPNRFPPFQEPGTAEVVVYSPRHDDDLAYLPASHAGMVAEAWMSRTEALASQADVAQVFVFENRGARVGASVAHPHGQIYGYPTLAPRLARELAEFSGGPCPLCRERDPERIVLEISGWRLVAPPVPRMPYELWLVPAMHGPRLVRTDLAPGGLRLLQTALRALDRRFGHRTELTWGIYQDTRPVSTPYHWRIDILPYERGGGRFKYLAGSELQMDAFLCDVSPKTTVRELRLLAQEEWDRP